VLRFRKSNIYNNFDLYFRNNKEALQMNCPACGSRYDFKIHLYGSRMSCGTDGNWMCGNCNRSGVFFLISIIDYIIYPWLQKQVETQNKNIRLTKNWA